MYEMEVRDHLLFVNGKRSAFRQTPNMGGALRPEGIILHDTAGALNAEGSISWLCNPQAKASAHTVTAMDGATTQLAAFNRQTWHAGKSNYHGRANCNGFTVGIEIVNPGRLSKLEDGSYRSGLGVKVPASAEVERKSTPMHGDGFWMHYPQAQIEAVIAQCLALREAYPTIKFIDTHWFISPGRKFNTNPLFPLESVRALVFGRKPEDSKSGDSDGVVNVASLNLRANPGVEHKVLASLNRGAKVLIRGTEMNGLTRWLRVDVGSKSGWVAASYVDIQ